MFYTSFIYSISHIIQSFMKQVKKNYLEASLWQALEHYATIVMARRDILDS